MNLSLALAARYLRFRKRQSVVAILGVAMGVAFFIALATIMQGFQKYLISQIIDFYPHITMYDEYRKPPLLGVNIVYGPEAAIDIHNRKPKDSTLGIRNWPLIEAGLARIPGTQAAGIMNSSAILRLGSTTRSTPILGLDPIQHRHVIRMEDDMTEGRLDDLYTTQNGIILPQPVLDDLGAKLGDTVQAVSGRGVRMSVKIVGVLETDRVAYMLLKRVQVLEQRPNRINQVRMRITDINAAPEIAKQIESQFQYKAESWQEANARIFSVFFLQNLIRYSTVSAIMIVAAFGIFNIISTIIHEKAKDIAILKSLGFREKTLSLIFVIQGLVLAFIGILIGWALGYAMVEGVASLNLNMGRSGGIKLDRSINHYLISAGFALAAAVGASWWPSRKAAAVNPVEIIRGVG